MSFFLIAALGVLLGFRALVAQKSVDLSEASWLIHRLTAWSPDSASELIRPTAVVLVVFVLNLALASREMIRKILAKRQALAACRSSSRIRQLSTHRTFPCGRESETEYLEKRIRSAGFRITRRVEEDGEIRLSARRRSMGDWGSLTFHASFFVILVGALVSVLTRFDGAFELAPGETFVEGRDAFLQAGERPVLFGEDEGLSLRLESLDVAYYPEGRLKDRASEVSLLDDTGEVVQTVGIEVNRPLRLGGTRIYQANRQGYIAGIDATDSRGKRVSGKVHFLLPKNADEPMIGTMSFPNTDLELMLELFTDRLKDVEGMEPRAAHAPVSLLHVSRRHGPHWIFLGTLFGGADLDVGGVVLTFVSLKPFATFSLTRDHGVPVIFFGLLVLLWGLIVLYFWVPENLWLAMTRQEDATRIWIAASTEKFQESFAERFHGWVDAWEGEIS